MNINELTPIETKEEFYIKRDDMFSVYGVRGGKVRSAYMLIQEGCKQGFREFVTAGSRFSPQCEIISYLCQALNLKAHLFMPRGENTSVIDHIENNNLSEIHRVKVGYNNVICSYAKQYAQENNFYYIPFGMECKENIEITKYQVANIPSEAKRIVMPCGSGMSMISVITGLNYYKMFDKEVVGISVGKDPIKNFKKYLPTYFSALYNNTQKVKYTILKSELPYEKKAENYKLGDLELDKIYEAKCIPYLKKGDLLWVVGRRV